MQEHLNTPLHRQIILTLKRCAVYILNFIHEIMPLTTAQLEILIHLILLLSQKRRLTEGLLPGSVKSKYMLEKAEWDKTWTKPWWQ